MIKKSILIGVGAVTLVFTAFLFLIIGMIISSFQPGGDKVGVIEIKGLIRDSEEINKQIIAFKNRPDIKAIVLRIDSPGGGVAPSQEMYNEVKKAKKENKIVVASMGSVAASGGYYIAVAADKIIANPGTITGSIGVIMQFANVKDLLSKLGVEGFVLKSGKFKDSGSPLREMKEEEKKILQELIDDIYQQFVEIVAENRGLDVKEVRKIADGRIFSGVQAKAVRLVDELGNLQDAIEVASSLAGIEGKPDVIYPKKKGVSFLELLFGKVSSPFLELFHPVDFGPKFLPYSFLYDTG